MSWLPTLITKTPEEGYEVAMKLSRMAVKKTQPDEDARSLTMASHVVATNFQTVAQANNFWRD